MKLNPEFGNLKQNYLFAEVANRTAAYAKAHPDAKIIKLGIGDVTRPLAPVVVEAAKRAADELGSAETFRGYGPYEGYGFARNAVASYYGSFGVSLSPDEVFICDGAKNDLGALLDLFDRDNTVLVQNPVYPVYVDTNIIDARRIVYAAGSRENGFLPMPDESVDADIIYICSPNNPTGAAYSREQLKEWVDYANRRGAIILFDAAYESFIAEPGLPRSIFEIDGARDCAVEFSSLSKTAGFTGVRAGYTVIPSGLSFGGVGLHGLWLRRQATKYNGTSYIIQRMVEAVFTPEGRREIAVNLDYYRKNAALIAKTLDSLGIVYTGGKNSPYIWLQCPGGMSSWEFFDFLLDRANVVGTPGEGFGSAGRGYFRLTAFGDAEATAEACERIVKVIRK